MVKKILVWFPKYICVQYKCSWNFFFWKVMVNCITISQVSWKYINITKKMFRMLTQKFALYLKANAIDNYIKCGNTKTHQLY